jgi:dUTP pyrophosphatase
MKLEVKKLHPDAKVPTIAYESDAGYDLYAYITKEESDYDDIRAIDINQYDYKEIGTGIAVAIPQGYYGRVAPKGGLARNNGIDILAGVVDAGYRGEIKVLMLNNGIEDYMVFHDNKIAQLIITKIETPPIEVVDDLSNTERGEKRYGSSGV